MAKIERVEVRRLKDGTEVRKTKSGYDIDDGGCLGCLLIIVCWVVGVTIVGLCIRLLGWASGLW